MNAEAAAGILVIRSGLQLTLQDGGRPAQAHLGLGRSGWLDAASAHAANRLVGNPAETAVLEQLLGNAEFEFTSATVVAVTGALGLLRLNGSDVATRQPIPVRAGDRLILGAASQGARFYVAVRGGFETPGLLGSVSWDALAEVGTPPLKAGDFLAFATANKLAPELREPVWAADPSLTPAPPTGLFTCYLTAGPRTDWLAPGAWQSLLGQTWQISPASNRTGIRLEGQPLSLAHTEPLPSEGIVVGSVQLPPNGKPIIFLADHPVTGGYPVIAVVRQKSLDGLAQLLPGQNLRFLG